jgi:alkylation response protein AidB-like acyl-CoA dehydrogenase
MYLDLLAARDATREAAQLLDANVAGTGPKAALSTEVELALSSAHVTSTAAALRIARAAHQLCGGWGQLDEAGLHHYTRAIKSAEGQLGSANAHRATIASLLVGRIPRD